MAYSVEVTRSNVTLTAFFSAVKAACAKQGIGFEMDRDYFENPPTNEDARYYVRDGKKFYTYNGHTTELPGEDAACKSEICRTKPLDYQVYIQNWDGSVFNEICEFTFDTEKRGHGYYFQTSKDATSEAIGENS